MPSIPRDQDIFILEDDDPEDHEPDARQEMPPSYETNGVLDTADKQDDQRRPETQEPTVPSKYYLSSKDTLQGIALKYGLSVGNHGLFNDLKLIHGNIFVKGAWIMSPE